MNKNFVNLVITREQLTRLQALTHLDTPAGKHQRVTAHQVGRKLLDFALTHAEAQLNAPVQEKATND